MNYALYKHWYKFNLLYACTSNYGKNIIEGVWEEVAEENIWTQEGGSKRRLERIA